jgi:hypothetical protein
MERRTQKVLGRLGQERKVAVMYVRAHAIHVGQWRFFPEVMAAQNMHNGTWARFYRTSDDGWAMSCVNCPADWMFKELADWFANWINGKQ